MKMVPGWLREEPGGFARIAKNEKHVTCRSGKRESGGTRTTPEDADGLVDSLKISSLTSIFIQSIIDGITRGVCYEEKNSSGR
jgi:hypothetical protein